MIGILDEAAAIIDGDRERTYGDPAKNLRRIAAMWTAILGTDVRPEAVCLCMIALKVARLVNDPTHHDSQVDVAGYAALLERVTARKADAAAASSPAAPQS